MILTPFTNQLHEILLDMINESKYRIAINVCTLYLNEKLTMKANSDWLENLVQT